MAVHKIESLVFLVEYPGLSTSAEDGTPVSDRAYGAEQRRRLYAAMEATRAASWVRERRLGVRFAPTEPHQGRIVFRMTFALEEDAAEFAEFWLPQLAERARAA